MARRHPELGRRVVSAIADIVEAGRIWPVKRAIDRIIAFVPQFADEANRGEVARILKFWPEKTRAQMDFLLADKRMAHLFPEKAVSMPTNDRALAVAIGDWICSPDLPYLLKNLRPVAYRDGTGSCSAMAVARFAIGYNALVPRERKNWDFRRTRDPVADETADMLDREDLASALIQSRRATERGGALTVAA